MPIQNVGTLLENLVVTETAVTLLRFCSRDAPLEFVNSFSMPPLTQWCSHTHNGGFDDVALDRVEQKEFALPGSSSLAALGPRNEDPLVYARLLRCSLCSSRGRGRNEGPNAALLVAGVALQAGAPCRMWLNDVRRGRYGDAIPQLEQLAATAQTIYNDFRGESHFELRTSDVPYPDSISDLKTVLREWPSPAGARLGFLDPMRYQPDQREGDHTSSQDHKRWLREIALERLTCAVHFTANSNLNGDQKNSLPQDVRRMHDDAASEGYDVSRTFQRQHYAVFLTTRSPLSGEAEQVAVDIEKRVKSAWDAWGQTFTSSRDWSLKVYRDGFAAK